MVSKHMKEIAEAGRIDSSSKDSASEYGSLGSKNEVNLESHSTMRRSGRRFVGDFSNLTPQRAAMTELHATLDGSGTRGKTNAAACLNLEAPPICPTSTLNT